MEGEMEGGREECTRESKSHKQGRRDITLRLVTGNTSRSSHGCVATAAGA